MGTTADDSDKPRSRLRKVGMIVLIVLTGLSMLATTLAVWVDRTLLDTDSWVATVGPLAADPDVQNALANELTTQLFASVDIEAKVQSVLPDRAGVLAAPLTSTVEGYVADAVRAVLGSEQFQTAWIELNRIAHENAVALLRGESVAGVSSEEGQVSLNLLPLMSRVLTFVDEKAPGLLTDDRPIPEITAETDVDQARAELGTALGVDLPDSFGVIDLYDSDQLAAAQRVVELLDRLVIVLPILSIGFAAATVLIAERRRRAVIGLGLSVAALVAVGFGLTRAIRNQILELISSPENRRALASAISTVVYDLRVLSVLLIVAGLVVSIAAFLTGDSRPALAIRRAFDGAAQHVPAARDRVEEIRAGVAIAGAGLLVLWLLVGDPTWAALLVAVIVLALFETAIALLRA